MVRDNFYVLLKLDPSENDEAVINEAIERSLNLWKDNLNKGIGRAKWEGYLKLEQEIRRVMLNPQLRQVEAEAAKDAKPDKAFDKWAADFARDPIEKGLTDLGIFSVYDFLSMDSDGNTSDRLYEPDDSFTVLKKRISALSEEYRQKNKTAEQTLIGKCSALLEDSEKKKHYDKYIVQKLKKEIEQATEIAQYKKEISNSAYQNNIKKYTKSWFSVECVREVANSYCRQKGYEIKNEPTAEQQSYKNGETTSNEWDKETRQYQEHYSTVETNKEDLVYIKKMPNYYINQLTMLGAILITLGFYYPSYNRKVIAKFNVMSKLAFGDDTKEIKFSIKLARILSVMTFGSLELLIPCGMLNTLIGLPIECMFVCFALMLIGSIMLLLHEWKLSNTMKVRIMEIAARYGCREAAELVSMGGSMSGVDKNVYRAFNLLIDVHNNYVDECRSQL
jgi:hypothetical protein